MKFTKMQGLGNDYVYVNCFEEKIENPPAVARYVSDRHFGIGSDGLIMINPSEVADFEMEMYNADGSRGEMCGNGIRCVAKYVYDYGLTDKTQISVETLGGIKYLDLTVEDGKVVLVKVDMGKPELKSDLIPIISENEKVIDADTPVSMNMWGLTPDFLTTLGDGFQEFFEKEVPGNPLKAEYLIPIFIGELLEQGKMSVKVLKTNDTWYGMTYHEDVAAVKDSFKKMLANGVYKADLFSDL